MKKTLLLIAVLFLTSLISYAQTEKGSQTLGLNFGFTYSKGNSLINDPNSGVYYKGTNQTTNFNIGPAYSYFIANKTDLGGYFSYSLSNSSYPYYPNGLSKTSGHAYGGEIFLRKYLMFANKLGVRTGPYLNYSRNESTIVYQPSIYGNYVNSNVRKTGEVGVLLDLVYFPLKNLGITAQLANLGFSHYTAHDYQHNSSSGNSVNMILSSNSLSLSVVYAFGK